jgi:hypothetical protein
VILPTFVLTICVRFRCILSTDIGGRSATIIWACLSFFLAKVNSQGFDDEKQKELSEYKTNMVNIKQYASDLQTFLALKQIGSEVEVQDTCLHALVNSDNLKQTKISCNIVNSLSRSSCNLSR